MQRYLFDRLCTPLQIAPLDEQEQLAQLRASITLELQRLVGNRAYFSGLHEPSKGSVNILNFGIDTVTDFSPQFSDKVLLAEQIKKVIQQFEPRLHNPHISVQALTTSSGCAKLRIVGQINQDISPSEFSTLLDMEVF